MRNGDKAAIAVGADSGIGQAWAAEGGPIVNRGAA